MTLPYNNMGKCEMDVGVLYYAVLCVSCCLLCRKLGPLNGHWAMCKSNGHISVKWPRVFIHIIWSVLVRVSYAFRNRVNLILFTRIFFAWN